MSYTLVLVETLNLLPSILFQRCLSLPILKEIRINTAKTESAESQNLEILDESLQQELPEQETNTKKFPESEKTDERISFGLKLNDQGKWCGKFYSNRWIGQSCYMDLLNLLQYMYFLPFAKKKQAKN